MPCEDAVVPSHVVAAAVILKFSLCAPISRSAATAPKTRNGIQPKGSADSEDCDKAVLAAKSVPFCAYQLPTVVIVLPPFRRTDLSSVVCNVRGRKCR